MARTYGEIVQASFEDVFAQALDRRTAVFVDIGSGKGLITAAAAQEGGFAKAVGVEKYRDKYDESMQLWASMPEDVKQRLDFTLSDIADLDLRELIQTWAQPEVLLFCNNLAFGHGMNGRYWLCSSISRQNQSSCLASSIFGKQSVHQDAVMGVKLSARAGWEGV